MSFNEYREDPVLETLDSKSPPPLPFAKEIDPPASTKLPEEKGDDDGDCPEKKKLRKTRYDPLGREIIESNSPEVEIPSSPKNSINVNTNEKLKRPRGRPPKGKIWHETKGWISEGLGGGRGRPKEHV